MLLIILSVNPKLNFILFFFQEAFTAFHPDMNVVKKYLKPIHIGHLQEDTHHKDLDIKKDFEELRQTAEKMVGGNKAI